MSTDETKKKRGRPAAPKPEPVIEDFPTETPPEMRREEALLMAMDRMVQSQDVLIDIGVMRASLFYATVADSVIAETFEKIKEGKKYKHLQYRDENGKVRHVADFDEFCRVFLGKSLRRCREIAANRKMLGPEHFEQAESIGLTQRHYSAIRALPDEDEAVIKEAIAKESKDEVIEILEDAIAKRREEQQAAEAEKQKLLQAAAAKDELLREKNSKIDELAQELKKEEAEFTWHQESLELAAEMGVVTTEIDHWVTKLAELLITTETVCHHIDDDEKRSVAIHYHEAVEHVAAWVANLQYETAASLDKYIGIADRYRLAPPATDENGVVIDAADDPVH